MSIRNITMMRASGLRSVLAKRSIYLHTGSRVSGLKKDPQEVFTTPLGHRYEASEANLKHIKQYLSDKFAISDDLALQVLTHKSFGNGIKPYNEKLTVMGQKLLSLFFARKVTNGCNESTKDMAINGKNLDCLGSPMAKELAGRFALGVYAKASKLNSVMFWKSYGYELSFESSGELKVSAQMMYALVGAVTFTHGKRVAEQFIQEKLVEGVPSLEDITVKIIDQSEN